MTKREPDGEASDPPRGRSRRWVRWLGIAAAAEVAAVGMVAAALFGVLGPWPQQQSDRLRGAAGEWREQVFGEEQPVCDPVPVEEGAAPPAATFVPMALPNAFQVAVSNAECAWIDFDIPRSLDLHARWEFGGGHIPEIRMEQVWAARDMTAPWTLTAVGPGGVTVIEGEIHLLKSED